jgi:hypothetical protein
MQTQIQIQLGLLTFNLSLIIQRPTKTANQKYIITANQQYSYNKNIVKHVSNNKLSKYASLELEALFIH